MLIFQRHLPHVIPNSMQALRVLSHSKITFRKAPFPYQHVSFKLQLMTRLPSQRQICPLTPGLGDGRIFGMYFHMTSLLHVGYLLMLCQIQQLLNLRHL